MWLDQALSVPDTTQASHLMKSTGGLTCRVRNDPAWSGDSVQDMRNCGKHCEL